MIMLNKMEQRLFTLLDSKYFDFDMKNLKYLPLNELKLALWPPNLKFLKENLNFSK